MNLKPQISLSEQEVNKGLSLVIVEGMTTEAMVVFTQGAFLIALALLMGASNFQIGLLSSLPIFTNVFQLVSIWLVRRFNNRRAISVVCSLIARLPLLIIGFIVIYAANENAINFILFFLLFHYAFSSISGPSWNAWMKDLVPENKLGAFFSQRGRTSQILNVTLSIILALTVDYIKHHYARFELNMYGIMFIAGGIIGICGVFLLYKTPEPHSRLSQQNIFTLLKKPLTNSNFVKLLVFNAAWVFSINIAIPFFTVFMMKSLGLPLSYIISLTIISQVSSILTIRLWGKFADRYSNKTIITIGAPLYIFCMIGWCFAGIYTNSYANLALLSVIHVFMGLSNAGINLALTNIGLKLAPKQDAIVYLSAKNIIVGLFSFLAPLTGGILADYFSNRHLNITGQWKGPGLDKTVHLLLLNEWNFLFLIGALLALIAVQLLSRVKEAGEVQKDIVVKIMRTSIRSNIKENFIIGNLLSWHTQLRNKIRKKML